MSGLITQNYIWDNFNIDETNVLSVGIAGCCFETPEAVKERFWQVFGCCVSVFDVDDFKIENQITHYDKFDKTAQVKAALVQQQTKQNYLDGLPPATDHLPDCDGLIKW
nr:Putative uncharacterized protein [Moritella viscosa]